VVGVKELEQLLDILAVETAHVPLIVEVTGGWADQDQAVEQIGSLDRGEDSYHGAHGVTDEDTSLNTEFVQIFTRSSA
jgi:type II secretory pathway component PulK